MSEEIHQFETTNRAFEHYIRTLRELLDSDTVKMSPSFILERMQKKIGSLIDVSENICKSIIEKQSASDAYDKKQLFRNVISIYINDLEKSKGELQQFMDENYEELTIEDELRSAYAVLYEYFTLRETEKDIPVLIDL